MATLSLLLLAHLGSWNKWSFWVGGSPCKQRCTLAVCLVLSVDSLPTGTCAPPVCSSSHTSEQLYCLQYKSLDHIWIVLTAHLSHIALITGWYTRHVPTMQSRWCHHLRLHLTVSPTCCLKPNRHKSFNMGSLVFLAVAVGLVSVGKSPPVLNPPGETVNKTPPITS